MQGTFLRQLSDFTELRRKNEDFSSSRSGQTDPDLQTNDLIMRSFRELRDKLKQAQRESQSLREEIKTLQVLMAQTQQLQNNQRSITLQLRDGNAHLQHSNEQLKRTIILAKQQLAQKEELEQKLSFTKSTLTQFKTKCDGLQLQKKKTMTMQAQQRLELQQEMERLRLKSRSDQSYMLEMERALGAVKEQLLKTQNQLKKLQIQHEQHLFNSQWSKDSFQKAAHQAQTQQLTKQLDSLTCKLKQEKQKRHDLQQRVIELEQAAGLSHLQAETYQGETGLMAKKMHSIQRRASKTKNNLERLTSEKFEWEQRFSKATSIAEELIARVKRELTGDSVELARTCEFRLNKLKDKDPSHKENKSKEHRENTKEVLFRESSQRQLRSESKPRKNEKQKEEPLTHAGSEETPRSVLAETQTNCPSNPVSSDGKDRAMDDLDVKIRREREQMEKRLKEKLLFRKLQVCASPLKASLRQDYLQLMFQP